jgi:hypothetical protein
MDRDEFGLARVRRPKVPHPNGGVLTFTLSGEEAVRRQMCPAAYYGHDIRTGSRAASGREPDRTATELHKACAGGGARPADRGDEQNIFLSAVF